MEYLSYFDPSLAYDDEQRLNSNSNNNSGDGNNNNNNNTTQQDNTPFAQKVREMSSENFLSCLSMCYEQVMVSVVKAGQIHDFLESELTMNIEKYEVYKSSSITGTGGGNSINSSGIANVDNIDGGDDYLPPTTANNTTTTSNSNNSNTKSTTNTSTTPPLMTEECKQIQLQAIAQSKATLAAACELTQHSMSQLITLRKENNAKLSADKMKFLWEISLQFVLSLEQISGSTAYIMRQCLLAQTKSFLEYLHETYKGKLVVTLDNERWIQCDVSSERQSEVDKLASGECGNVIFSRSIWCACFFTLQTIFKPFIHTLRNTNNLLTYIPYRQGFPTTHYLH